MTTKFPNLFIKQIDRGLRSGLALILFCLFGTAFAVWITHGARHDGAQNQPQILVDTLKPSFAVSDTPSLAALPVPQSTLIERSGKLQRRSTPLKVLRNLGAEGRESYKSLQAIYNADLVNPRRLRAGLPITAHFDANNNQLISVSFRLPNDTMVFSKRLANGEFFATDLKPKLNIVHKSVRSTISTSLYEAALEGGLKDRQIADFAQIFAFDINFQREVHKGDAFEIVYETYVNENGREMRSGDVVFAAFHGRSVQKDYYRFTPSDDNLPDYFAPNGKSATRFLMKTPINGARLSSNFGKRRHPISGYTRLHKGTDFAARTGTPVMAAGNGVVKRASRYGGYGKYVRIQHANGYETAYAHMSRYGSGVKKGARVRQGSIIGYVGSTGASTGPHLHYEVMINGKHVNAMALKLPTGRVLDGVLLESFHAHRAHIDAIRRRLNPGLVLADLKPNATPQLN